MPDLIPSLDKDSYTPEEVNEIIKSQLGEDTARVFRMYFNKVQKVPPHDISIHDYGYGGGGDTEQKEYRFSMQDYAKEIGIPPEVLAFTMVPSSRHGGGGQFNMGWLQIKYFPTGIAYLEEIQSDFQQRISRLRQLISGKMDEKDLIQGFEAQSWEKIKSNKELIISKENGAAQPVQPQVVGNWRLEQSAPWSDTLISIYYKDNPRVSAYMDKNKSLQLEDVTPEEKAEFEKDLSQISLTAGKMYEALLKSQQSPYEATPMLRSIINKIESTGYSDIMNYLFNKAVSITKAHGAKELIIPTSQMKISEWKGNAKHGLEALTAFFQRIYDDNAKAYNATKQAKEQFGTDVWVIDLATMQDIRLSHRRLANWQSKDGMNAQNWTGYVDTYIDYYRKNPMAPGKDEYQNEGGVMEENDPNNNYMMLSGFIDEMVPAGAYGDENWVSRFKKYLDQKYGIELPPELESRLLHGATEHQWTPKSNRPPTQEVDPSGDAPSAEDLNKMFKLEFKSLNKRYNK